MFDLTEISTFQHVDNWIKQVSGDGHKRVSVVHACVCLVSHDQQRNC